MAEDNPKGTATGNGSEESKGFGHLYLAEQNILDGIDSAERKGSGSTVSEPGPAGERRVTYAEKDRVGLALSGGGIRSATFNLGLLQQLAKLDLLRLVDYLSTVSGGGYIGGWWTAWKKKRQEAESGDFPSSDVDLAEPHEVRHLREFSNFLIPRRGVMEMEFWYCVVALLKGLLVGLATAASGMMLAFLLWIVLTQALCETSFGVALLFFFCLTVCWLSFFEAWYRGTDIKRVDQFVKELLLVVVPSAAAAAPAALAWWGVASWLHIGVLVEASPATAWWERLLRPWLTSESFWVVPGTEFRMLLFAPALAWLGSAGMMMLFHLLFSRFSHGVGHGPWRRWLDRATARILALAGAWSILTALWCVGGYLGQPSGLGRVATALTAITTSALFVWLRDWLVSSPAKPISSLTDRLKPLVPQLLGYVTLVLAAVSVAGLLMLVLQHHEVFWVELPPLAVIFAVLLLVDPENVGLHAFYRDRIARTFPGASRSQTATDNRQTEPMKDDDFKLSKTKNLRPIHLICCTANALADDRLDTLSRRARSAVLSGSGIAIGDECAKPGDLPFASALTASAAAFNSNMGSLSDRYGPAVTFLMTALNLRLGLWIPHPKGGKVRRRDWRRRLKRVGLWITRLKDGKGRRPDWWRRRNRVGLWTTHLKDGKGWASVFPGLLYLREMFGLTSCKENWVHLSDGGHFENLGLYELVRRQCRYIIVSDCGADPDVAFDDFGNAVRRVREDFGVDIKIDLEPLRPKGNGLSRQHVAVGRIRYGQPNDTGLLLYFKPTLTGDEPCDIAQYKTRNREFPHESTTDQFYDEAQWESYRRLGEHAVEEAFGFLKAQPRKEAKPKPGQGPEAHEIFTAVWWEWYPGPEELHSQLVDLTERYKQLEAEIRRHAPIRLRYEMFPELKCVKPDFEPDAEDEAVADALSFLLQMIQFMEDVWDRCSLDTEDNHPLNQGWINLFQRWIHMPSFQTWWPILTPLYGVGLRRFVERIGGGRQAAQVSGRVRQVTPAEIETLRGPAGKYWKSTGKQIPEKGCLYIYELSLPARAAGQKIVVEVGVACVQVKDEVAEWKWDDLVVVPGLWGAGIGGQFLSGLLEELTAKPRAWHPPRVRQCKVTPPEEPELGTNYVDLYISAGFHWRKAEADGISQLVWDAPP